MSAKVTAYRLYRSLVSLATELQMHVAMAEGITAAEVRGELQPYLLEAEDRNLAIFEPYIELWPQAVKCKQEVERHIRAQLRIDYLSFCQLSDEQLMTAIERLELERPGLAEQLDAVIAGESPGVWAELQCRMQVAGKPEAAESQPAATAQQQGVDNEESEYIFRRDGDGWLIRAFGVEGHFKSSKGFNYLARLVSRAGQSCPLLYLVAEDVGKIIKFNLTGQKGETVIDKQALQKYHEEIKDCDADIAQAEREGREDVLEHLRAKKEELLRQVAAVTGKGGRLRHKSDAKRLRDRIQKALKRTYEVFREATPPMAELADHLEAFIEITEEGCIYKPVPPIDWATQF